MVQVKPSMQKPILVGKSAGRGYRIRYHIRYPTLTSHITYDIVCDVSNVILYTMSYTMSYLNLRHSIRYSAPNDIIGHIVGQNTVLANYVSNCTYDILGHTESDGCRQAVSKGSGPVQLARMSFDKDNPVDQK
jgi:hypothetical protein